MRRILPLSLLLLLGVAVWVFFWAVGSGQFDDLDTPAERPQACMIECSNILTIEKHPASGRLQQPQNRSTRRGLPATRFSHQPDGLSGPQLQGDAVHRPDGTVHPPQDA